MKQYISIIALVIISINVFSQDTIYWNKNKNLIFSDFKGIPPVTSEFKAISSLSINYETLSNYPNYTVSIKAIFLCENAWFKDKSSIYLLNHEQRHFDIMEIYARMTRKAISNKIFELDNMQKEYDEAISSVYKQYKIIDNQYDKETNLSQDEYCQDWWNKYIDEQLEELKEYSDPIVKLRIKEE